VLDRRYVHSRQLDSISLGVADDASYLYTSSTHTRMRSTPPFRWSLLVGGDLHPAQPDQMMWKITLQALLPGIGFHGDGSL
jgi:hypothetical protein